MSFCLGNFLFRIGWKNTIFDPSKGDDQCSGHDFLNRIDRKAEFTEKNREKFFGDQIRENHTLKSEFHLSFGKASIIALLCGLYSIALQTVLVRITGLVMGASEYAFSMVVAVFIAMLALGALHLSKPSDFIPELQGRFPIRVELDNLTQDDFLKILSEPKNSLTKQYKALIKSEDVEIIFNDDALIEISNKAFIINSEIENIGARRLHTVMSKLLNEILFDIPEKIGPNAKVVITKKMVEEKLNSITENKDLSEYIL